MLWTELEPLHLCRGWFRPIPHKQERIKREISIQRLAEARGVQLRRMGRSLMGLCPFHKDTNPSLSIDPVKNEWHCFGCDRKGDVIEWVKCAEGVSFMPWNCSARTISL